MNNTEPVMQVYEHWLSHTRRCQSPFYNARPDEQAISLLVVHCISLPRGHYRNGMIDKLFTGTLAQGLHKELDEVAQLHVSAHLFIDRQGQVTQYVPFNQRAWHAGVSQYAGQENCNDFSIGIELEGTDESHYTQAQYQQLAAVTQVLLACYPNLTKQRITAHSSIAPGRKTDPGIGFDWDYYWQLLNSSKNESCR